MTPNGRGIDRRTFLKLTAAGSGLAILGCGTGGERRQDDAEVGMRYRPLGRTGLEVSEIAFGAHGVDNPPLMSAALDAGINTFCTSGQYLDGMEEKALGEAMRKIGGRRDGVVILTGNVTRRGSTKRMILDSIDASLRRLQTDRIEVYYTGSVGSPDDLRVDALYEAFHEAKRAGKVLHLGLAGHHGGMQDCLNAAIEDGRIDVFFTKYDFVSYPDQGEILRRAAEKGIGTIVFKTNAGNRQNEIKDLEAGGLSFPQATVKWALTHPYVASVAVTLTNFDQIREYTAAVASTLTRSEVGMLRRYRDEMADRYCRFCGECEASCPHDVAVADVMRYAMYFKYYAREKEAMQLYGVLPAQHSARVCARCAGPCGPACPFGRAVRAELVEAHRLLSFPELRNDYA
jgi:aryl-alcohol dehydrogenase-like predicted oxidoreductase